MKQSQNGKFNFKFYTRVIIQLLLDLKQSTVVPITEEHYYIIYYIIYNMHQEPTGISVWSGFGRFLKFRFGFVNFFDRIRIFLYKIYCLVTYTSLSGKRCILYSAVCGGDWIVNQFSHRCHHNIPHFNTND